MAQFDNIDCGFYGAYAQHGRDLVERYGTDGYFWVRLGFIGPAHLTYVFFGPLGGFYVLRYILALVATVPLYLLLRQWHGKSLGLLGVVLVITSPVFYNAWGDDYPDSAALSYLLAASSLLLLQTRRRRDRILVLFGSGAFYGLALHCQAVTAALVASAVGGYVAVMSVARRRHTVRNTLWVDCAVIFGGIIAVSSLFVLISWLWFGQWDIFSPTWRNYLWLRTPSQVANWHSANWRWSRTVPYVVLPPVLAGAWLLQVVFVRPRRAEVAAGVGAVLQIGAFYALQFVGDVATVEFKSYSAMLWAPVTVLAALILIGLIHTVVRNGKMLWLPVGAVVGVALFWSFFSPTLDLRGGVRMIGAAATILLLGVLAVLYRRRIVAAFAVVGFVVVGFVVTTAPTARPALPGTSPFTPHADYGRVLGHAAAEEIDAYRVAARIPALVGPATAPGQQLVFWWPYGAPGVVNQLSTEYLWRQLESGVPSAERLRTVVAQLRTMRPAPLVLIGADEHDFGRFLATLNDAGVRLHLRKAARLESGSVSVVLWVVDVDASR